MTRYQIVFSTRAGTTRHVAQLIAAALREAGHEAVVADAALSPEPAGECYIVGSSIIANRWNPEGLAWLERHAVTLAGRVALFNVCLTAADPDKRAESLALNSRAAAIIAPIANASFAGRYTPERSRWWQRLWLKAMAKPAQDHVDPEAISAWARDVARLAR